MDLTETLTLELRSKTIKRRNTSVASIESGDFGERKTGNKRCNESSADTITKKQAVGLDRKEVFLGIEKEPDDELTQEFDAPQFLESQSQDSNREFDSFVLTEDASSFTCNEICEIETADEEGMCTAGATIPFVPDSLEGKSLDHFYLQKRIGSGGMARVYLATDSLLKRNVAIKVIQNRKYVNDEHLANLLMAEAVAQAQLNHPNIVSIHYVGKIDGTPFLAMEYVPGQSLEQRLSNGAVPVSEAVAFTLQIIDALQHAESHDVVHGDIKPANLLIDSQNRIKLSDFGLARQVSEARSQIKKLVGTPSHMAPELFEKRPVDKQTDLYALGVTMFQMIFNRYPYELAGETAEEVKLVLDAAKIQMPVTWPEAIPVSLRIILTRLLEKDPADRYRSLEELKSDLEAEFGEKSAPAKTGIRCVALAIDFAIYTGASIPFFYQVDQLFSSGDSQKFLTDLIGCIPLLILPFFYLMISVMLRRTAGQVATQTKTIRLETIAVPIALFFRREVVRTLPIWCSLGVVAVALPNQIATILGIGCFAATIAVAGWLQYRSDPKSNIDQRFGTTEIVSG